MSTINDGGPAFPTTGEQARGIATAGMTMRDYFAAKAMQAQMTAVLGLPTEHIERSMQKARVTDPMDLFARNAYASADAMLKARES